MVGLRVGGRNQGDIVLEGAMTARLLLQRPELEKQDEYFRIGLQIGADGSVIKDGDTIYVLEGDIDQRVQVAEYFQMRYGDPEQIVCLATYASYHITEIISASQGFVTKCVTNIQRRFRQKQTTPPGFKGEPDPPGKEDPKLWQLFF